MRNGFRVPPKLNRVDECYAKLRQTTEQLQYVSRLLWLSLDQGGALTVSPDLLAKWPDGRVLAQDKLAGSMSIVWTAANKPPDAAAPTPSPSPAPTPSPATATPS